MDIKGIGASDGYAIAKVYRFEVVDINVEMTHIEDVEAEVAKLDAAVKQSIAELQVIKDKTAEQIDEESAAIFGAHIEILQDPEYIGSVKHKIQDEKFNCDYCLEEVTNMFIAVFDMMEDAYIKERVADIKDVSGRVLRNILGIKSADPSAIDEEVIVVAEDLTPSDTAQLNKQYVKGFVTNVGGRTSHSAIMARTLEIPAVVGTKTIFDTATEDDVLIVNGFTGEVIVNPEEALIAEYEEKLTEYMAKKALWAEMKDKGTKTKDGVHVELAANIGSPDDVEGALANGAEGVGLFRTEFLYMGKDQLPTEDEQFESYKAVLEKMGEKPVVIRTLDIGGDKELSYMDMDHEMNPFLGHRAIRLCMDKKDIFKTQLRALLRASIYGNLRIMFPMIATVDEFIAGRDFLMEAKAELEAEGVEVSDEFQLGIMIEIPAAALLADQFAKEVDFFSIGTNDLIQYTFAADRMNEKVSYLYQPLNPSLLRLIKNVINAAHKEGKWAGMCGEMAGDASAIPVLLGLGLDEFSMSATSILQARYAICDMNKKDAKELAEDVVECSRQSEVIEKVNNFLENK